MNNKRQKEKIKRFAAFIKVILSDGDWEYGDGTAMTEDARVFYRRWEKLEKNYANEYGALKVRLIKGESYREE